MTAYIRSIRGIERTAFYTPVQAVSRYASYPYREGEPQLPPNSKHDWNIVYQQAADSAAYWIRTAMQAQHDLNRITWDLSRYFGTSNPINEPIHNLTRLLNDLESQYIQHAGELKPELWAIIELALRHPAAEELGLRRSQESGMWVVDSAYSLQTKRPERNLSIDAGASANASASASTNASASASTNASASASANASAKPIKSAGVGVIADASSSSEPASVPRMKRLLLGADGMLTRLKTALTYADHQKAVDLLQLRLPTALPYAAYYGSIQSYWPLPSVGLILNRYL